MEDQEQMKKMDAMRNALGAAKASSGNATESAKKAIAEAKAKKAFVSSKKVAQGKGKSPRTVGAPGFMKVDRPRPGKSY